ncbi:MAG: 50S ribosomal protein L29 [archaeon]
MKFNNELKGLGEPDLQNRLEELQKELFKLQGQAATGNAPENPGKFRQVKKNIARIKTFLKQKELELTNK